MLRILTGLKASSSYNASFLQFRSMSKGMIQQAHIPCVTEMIADFHQHLKLLKDLPPCDDELQTKPLSSRTKEHSYRQMRIPLASKERMQMKYLSATGTVRIGKLLEDLDNFAAYICYCHNREDGREMDHPSSLPRNIVTASVQRMHLSDVIVDPIRDIIVDGEVTWTGSSSIECTMRVFQETSQGMDQKFKARFTMVSRYTHDRRKPARVHPLLVRTPEEAALFSSGGEALKQRKQEAETSLLNFPPTSEEMKYVHGILQETYKNKNDHLYSFALRDGQVWLHSTRMELTNVCFPENQNVYGTIFGGFLMRKAFELAYSTAKVFSMTGVNAVSVDDVAFRSAVEIGNILILKSQITYTTGKYMQISVTAEAVDTVRQERNTTNLFHFTMETSDGSKVKQVVPKHYKHALMHLNGKRHLEKTLAFVPAGQSKE